MNDATKLALAGAAGMLLATAVIFLFGRGLAIFTHVNIDDPPTVEEIMGNHETLKKEVSKGYTQLFSTGKDIEKQLKTAVQELNEVKQDIASRPAVGHASRQIDVTKSGKNIIYVNEYSDARYFKHNEEVDVEWNGTKIRAVVQGTIQNKDQDIILQLNMDAAEAIGLTQKKGVAKGVSARRVLKSSANKTLRT